jgi:hypothetical protein
MLSSSMAIAFVTAQSFDRFGRRDGLEENPQEVGAAGGNDARELFGSVSPDDMVRRHR